MNLLAFAFALLAAIIASLTIADIFRLAHVPDIVVAGLAILSAGALLLGVTIASVIERLGPPKEH